MNSVVAYLPLYRQKWYNWLIFFYSLFSLRSLQFILFSSLSPVPSHWFPLSYKLLILICHRQSIIADLSLVAFCIVIADLSEHHHRHRHRHHRSESTWASTLRWDRSVRHDRGHRRWDLDRGHRRWGEVRSWLWVTSASGFWLPVQVDLWLWVGGASSFVGLGCQW